MLSILRNGPRAPIAPLLVCALLALTLPGLAQTTVQIVLEGQVMDGWGKPLQGATVSAGHTETTTDAEGKFHLVLAAEPGSLEVRASLKNHPEIQQTARVEITGEGERKIMLRIAFPRTSPKMIPRLHKRSAAKSAPAPPEAKSPRSYSAEPPPPPPPPPPPATELPAPPALTPADRAIVRVLYATDRKPSGKTTTDDFYTGTSVDSGDLQYGACDVSIPILHERGQFESPSIWRFEWGETRGKHIVVLSIVPADKASFLSALHEELGKDPEGQLLVFVHGFNVSFEDAARRTAQISYDLEFKGAPVLYSWPSKADVAAYTADEATVDGTWRHFQSFLTDLALHTGARRIFVLAHSMGSRVVSRAIDAMVQSHSLSTLPVFTQLVLAAPDIDIRELNQLAANLRSASGRVTVYANSNDEAIKLSSKIHGAPRAGSSGQDIFLADGIDSVDATDTDTGFLQHSYYANAILLKDLSLLFGHNTPPPREGMKRELHGEKVFWMLEPQ